MDSTKKIMLRSAGRFLIVFPFLFYFCQYLLSPSMYISDFQSKYNWTRNLLMDNGLKMLSPIENIKGQQILAISLISFIMILLSLMFMLGDKRGIIIIMVIKCFQAYFLRTVYIYTLLIYIGITIHLIIKQYYVESQNQEKYKISKQQK